MRKRPLIWKGFAIGIILLFIAIAYSPTCSSQTSSRQTKSEGPDLKIVDIGIVIYYNYMTMQTYQIITCEVKNIGTTNVTYWESQGTAFRLFLFPSRMYGFCDVSWGFKPPLKPQESRWIQTINFSPLIRFFPGFYKTYIRVSTSGDVDPNNDIIKGTFFIYGKIIIPSPI